LPLPGLADCDQTLLPLTREARLVASQKLHRSPGWPCKASRLTWASEPAAWSRQFAGRQVRCRLNRRAAVATSLRSTRVINPRLPYGRPIKASEVGNFPYRSINLYGRRTEASRDRSSRSVPKCAFARGFLGGVRPWLASVRQSSSTARRGVGSRRRTTRRAARRRHPQPRTQLQRAFIDRLVCHRHIQVQGVATGAASEAVPAVLFHLRGKAAAARRLRSMHRARPTQLRAAARRRREADQVQHLRQR